MRASGFVVRFCIPLSLLIATASVFAQRPTNRKAERSTEDWLDNCRERGGGGGKRWRDDSEKFCEVREKRISATRTLDIDGQQNGGVSVHGWDQSEVLVVAKIQANADDADDAKDLASRISIETDNGRIRADGPSSRRNQSWSVSFDVWAPRQTDLRVSTHNGGISVEDVDARLDLGAVNGGIVLRGVSGDVRGETTNGPLDVDLDGDRWRGTGLDLRTTNGPVNLGIPQGYSARLETGTTNGGMRIDFPVTLQGSIGRRITTQLGNGGAPIRAITTNGPVVIRRR